MNDKDEGGSAFPRPETLYPDGRTSDPGAFGMSLRDYFAAKAMQGELASQHPKTGEYNNLDALAVLAYRIADAMLKARVK